MAAAVAGEAEHAAAPRARRRAVEVADAGLVVLPHHIYQDRSAEDDAPLSEGRGGLAAVAGAAIVVVQWRRVAQLDDVGAFDGRCLARDLHRAITTIDKGEGRLRERIDRPVEGARKVKSSLGGAAEERRAQCDGRRGRSDLRRATHPWVTSRRWRGTSTPSSGMYEGDGVAAMA